MEAMLVVVAGEGGDLRLEPLPCLSLNGVVLGTVGGFVVGVVVWVWVRL